MSGFSGNFIIFDGLLAISEVMKKTLLVVCLLSLVSMGLYGQAGNFRSRATGAWSNTNSWERDADSNGSFEESPASVTPTSASGTITVRNGHTITVGSNLSIDQTTINLGGFVIVSSGVTLTLNDGTGADLTFSSGFGSNRLDIFGRLIVPEGSTMASATSARLRIMTDGVYEHAYTVTGGQIYDATWQSNSRLEFTGYTSAADAPANMDQAFQNIRWNCPLQENFLDLNITGSTTSVGGDFEVLDTNGSFVVFGQSDYDLTIGGNLEISGNSAIAFAGFSPSTINLSIAGDLAYSSSATSWANVDAFLTLTVFGTFDVSNGSFDLLSGAGAATGQTDVFLPGNFTFSSGDISNSAGTAACTVQFVGNTLYTGGGTFTGIVNFLVESSSTLSLGTFNLSGSGAFTLDGTLEVGSINVNGAIQTGTSAGNIRVSGLRTYNLGSTIVYNNPTTAQFIGNGHPTTLGVNTTIRNPSGVTLASNTTIGGALWLDNGNLTVGSRTLTLNDSFTADSPNTLVISTASNILIGIGDAGSFGTLMTSGSSTLNNLTFSRNGQTLFLGTSLGVTGTFSHDGNVNFAGRNLTISGPYNITSGSLIGDGTSTLEIAGSGAISGDVPLQGTLGTLTINRPVGVTNTTSINISTALNILSGTYQGDGSVILANGATLTRGDGTITKSITATNYNLIYASTSPIQTGSELLTSPSTALNNLTITNNAVTLNNSLTTLTVNGTLTLTSGTFDANAKPIVFEGNVVSNATGDFIGSLVTFSGTSTLGGSVALEFDDVAVEAGATLNLGTVDVRIAGDFTPDAGSIMQPGSATTFFNGTTILTLPDNATQVSFNNVQISGNSSLTVTCADCGSENNRPAMLVNGTWNSDAANAVFNPAPNIGSNEVTAVRFTGAAQSIRLLTGHAFWDLRLAGTNTLTLNTDIVVSNDLRLEGTKTLNTGTNRAISVGGDFLFDGGSFTPNSGTVTFNGSANQTIDRLSGSGTPSFFNITINKGGGSFVNGTNVNLTNVFTISSNTAVDFDGASGTDVFTLVSTSSRTAIVAAILSPANPNIVTGNVTAQRYMDGEGEIYRYISSPVTNPQVVDLQGEIPVTGSFTGTSFNAPTNCAGCTPCVGCTTNNQSMFRYNGSLAGTINERYEDFPATANTETMAPTRGYSVFVREASNPTTWNLRGLINRGLQTFTPLAFTGAGANDSYNLVGNPYPSPIDWFVADGASTWSRTNIDPSIYTWDASIGNYATYNRMTNSGTNGGSRYIAIGQAFWIRTTAGGASMTANEGVKSSQQPTFFREKQPEDYLRLKLIASNGISNEALIHFNIDGASDNFDTSIDSYSFPDAALKFFTLSKDARPLAINALGTLDCTKEIAVGVGALSKGHYSIHYSEFESFSSQVNILFVDTYAGKSFTVDAKAPAYEFDVTADSASFGSNRFKLIFSNKNINLGVQATIKNICAGNDGHITLASSQAEVTYFASMDGARVSEEITGNGSQLNLQIPADLLAEGENTVVLMARYGSCDAVPAQSLTMKVGAASKITYVNHALSCHPQALKLSAAGASEGGSYRWYESGRGGNPIEGATTDTFITPELESSKSYYVSTVGPSGCESDRVEVKAEINVPQPAQILVDQATLRSNYTTGNTWLRDGEMISEDATISLTIPGIYTLEVKVGECLTTVSYEHNLNGIHIFPNPANETITINVESSNDVEVEVFNNMGVRQGSVMLIPAGPNRRMGTYDLSSGASGMYLIQIKDGAKLHLKKILKR